MSRSPASTTEETQTPPSTETIPEPTTTGPAEAEMPGWIPTEPTTTSTSSDRGLEEDDELDDVSAFESAPPPNDGTSTRSRASTADPSAFAEIAGAVVGMTSLLVRWLRARRRPNLPEHAWIADEEDVANIGGPLASIAARHSPIGDASADVGDGLALMLGTANYALKGVQAEAHLDAAFNLPDPEEPTQ